MFGFNLNYIKSMTWTVAYWTNYSRYFIILNMSSIYDALDFSSLNSFSYVSSLTFYKLIMIKELVFHFLPYFN